MRWGAIFVLPGLILGVPLIIAIRELLLEREEGGRWSLTITHGVGDATDQAWQAIADGGELVAGYGGGGTTCQAYRLSLAPVVPPR